MIEVDPDLKNELYIELARQGLTMKAWFVQEATRLVTHGSQVELFAAEPEAAAYEARKQTKDTDRP